MIKDDLSLRPLAATHPPRAKPPRSGRTAHAPPRFRAGSPHPIFRPCKTGSPHPAVHPPRPPPSTSLPCAASATPVARALAPPPRTFPSQAPPCPAPAHTHPNAPPPGERVHVYPTSRVRRRPSSPPNSPASTHLNPYNPTRFSAFPNYETRHLTTLTHSSS
ncbi:MAG: hypothetical protein RL376_1915 [Verrucomicrobiota bacterium]|jgi:hypothetical protein